jgi:filamentous hemagglutinin family protein
MRRFLFILALSVSLYAKPEGLHLIHGNVSSPMEETGKWSLESRGDAIIEWDKFSVEQAETLRFLQDSANSCILNRVIGGETSEILGQIVSNGHLLLINPKGVLIGSEGVIDTAGFIASSLDVLDSDFLAKGEMNFSGQDPAEVVHLGKIRCTGGDAILIGRTIRNSGEIDTPNGNSWMAEGCQVILKPEGTERVFISAGGVNVEEIRDIPNPYIKAIAPTDLTEASRIEKRGGEFYFTAESKPHVWLSSLLADSDDAPAKGSLAIYSLEEQEAIVNLSVADAQLSDQLPVYRQLLPYCGWNHLYPEGVQPEPCGLTLFEEKTFLLSKELP